MSILQNRKADNLKARMAEFLQIDHTSDGIISAIEDIINRSYESGVHGHSDHIEASRQMMLAKYREQPEPVRVMDVQPGSMLSLLLKEGE
jgi:hypothetical protein